jgi:hypothetical protein
MGRAALGAFHNDSIVLEECRKLRQLSWGNRANEYPQQLTSRIGGAEEFFMQGNVQESQP